MARSLLTFSAILLTFFAQSLFSGEEATSKDSSTPTEPVSSPSQQKPVELSTQDTTGQSVPRKGPATNLESAFKETLPAIVPRNPRVLFIIAPHCEKCHSALIKLKRLGGDFEAMRARGWKIGDTPDCHVQIVERDSIPELINRLTIREFPTVVCIDGLEIVRSFKSGCTTPLDAWTFGFLLTGKDERPVTIVSETAQVASTGSYRLRGNHWSVDGDWNPSRATMIFHLRSPNHGYQIAANYQIENWSLEELRSLHDDLHEREQRLYPSTASASTRSNTSTSSRNEFSASRKIIGGR